MNLNFKVASGATADQCPVCGLHGDHAHQVHLFFPVPGAYRFSMTSRVNKSRVYQCMACGQLQTTAEVDSFCPALLAPQ